MQRFQKPIAKVVSIIVLGLLMYLPVVAQNKSQRVKQRPTTGQTCKARSGLHCEFVGSGNPVLCLHGLGASLYTWRELRTRMPNQQLILIDFRGSGESPKPKDKKYSIQYQADLIYDFIQEHDLKNLTLLGNSYGGAVSLLVAIKLTEQDSTRFSKLILVDSGGYDKDLPLHLKLLRTPVAGRAVLRALPSKKSARMVLEYGYAEESRITDPQVDAYAKPIGARGGRHALLQMAKQAIPGNINEINEKYKKITVPTLILWGDQDRVIPLRIGTMLKTAIRNSQLVIIPSAGHVPQEEQPNDTVCEIRKFLEPGFVCP